MTADDIEVPPSKMQIRAQRAEMQRVDAVKVRAEIETATRARDEKTIRLRALRLAKEAADREAASLTISKPRKRGKSG